MPIDRNSPGEPCHDVFVVRDPNGFYTWAEVCDILDKAERLGHSLDYDTPLHGMTVMQIDRLVNPLQ